MRGWLAYHAHRQQRRRARTSATHHRRRWLAGTAFSRWRGRLAQRHLAQLQDQLARHVCERSLRRDAFMRWLSALDTRVERRESLASAEQVSRRSLLRTGLHTWADAYSRHEMRAVQHASAVHFDSVLRDRDGTADWFHHRQMYRRALGTWRVETARRLRAYQKAHELSELLDRHAKKRVFNGLRLLFLALEAWKEHVVAARAERASIDKAESHFKRQLARKVLVALHNRAQAAKAKQQREQQADSWRRSALMRRAWSAWSLAAYETWQTTVKMKRAAEFRQWAVVRNVFDTLRANAVQRREQREKRDVVDVFYKTMLLRRVLRGWAEHAEQTHIWRDQERQAVRFRYFGLASGCLMVWHKLADIDAAIARCTAEHAAHRRNVTRLAEMQAVLDAYLDGDHGVLQRGLGAHNRHDENVDGSGAGQCTSLLDLYDQIRTLKRQTSQFESRQRVMQSEIEGLKARLRQSLPMAIK
nr:hypothetical protein HK105_006185 [Polyrhizophydium stewartii]